MKNHYILFKYLMMLKRFLIFLYYFKNNLRGTLYYIFNLSNPEKNYTHILRKKPKKILKFKMY